LNYEPLIERDLDAIPAAAHAFLETHTAEELWISVTRFAVLAYAPSQHAKRAVLACRAAFEVREELGDRWPEMLIACARYAAASRQPWSEPPLLDPPQPSQGDVEELRAAVTAGDRLRAERWLSARLADAEVALRDIATGDALLLLDAAAALLPHLGEKGRYALFRVPVWEMVANGIEPEEDLPLETLIARAVAANGSPEAVTPVFVKHARVHGIRSSASNDTPLTLTLSPQAGRGDWESTTDQSLLPSVREEGGRRPDEGSIPGSDMGTAAALAPYDLARDYAQTLLAHGYHLGDDVLHAVHYNLEHGESFAAWSFA
jgi:hypothetical protein